jgi:hypothetical protein
VSPFVDDPEVYEPLGVAMWVGDAVILSYIICNVHRNSEEKGMEMEGRDLVLMFGGFCDILNMNWNDYRKGGCV